MDPLQRQRRPARVRPHRPVRPSDLDSGKRKVQGRVQDPGCLRSLSVQGRVTRAISQRKALPIFLCISNETFQLLHF